MLIPSILRILDQPQLGTKTAGKAEADFRTELAAAGERLSALQVIEAQIAVAAELAKSTSPEQQSPGNPLIRKSSLTEFLRTITKIEKSDPPPVVDFFE